MDDNQGTSRTYALRRLATHRPDLHARCLAGCTALLCEGGSEGEEVSWNAKRPCQRLQQRWVSRSLGIPRDLSSARQLHRPAGRRDIPPTWPVGAGPGRTPRHRHGSSPPCCPCTRPRRHERGQGRVWSPGWRLRSPGGLYGAFFRVSGRESNLRMS